MVVKSGVCNFIKTALKIGIRYFRQVAGSLSEIRTQCHTGSGGFFGRFGGTLSLTLRLCSPQAISMTKSPNPFFHTPAIWYF